MFFLYPSVGITRERKVYTLEQERSYVLCACMCAYLWHAGVMCV